ncbi:hypothetical protein D9613_006089 [Agrocybe pediades]|uniref:PH domain-containing protein n=1 Tax=Agrocybe pediades TaxID=84607 RepID=A0A8H4QV31_9AGAR|nr:hypothetical protein D9613_006089 [Agrocybe pediades]
MKLTKSTERSANTNPRSSNDKGKTPIRGSYSGSGGTSNFATESYVPHYTKASVYSSRDMARPSTADGALDARSRFRGSLLVAASDALGLKFGRRRPVGRQPAMPNILPDVIEISAAAARQNEEDEERSRLKHIAAQSLGIEPTMVSRDNRIRDDDMTDEDAERHTASDSVDGRVAGYTRRSYSALNVSGGGFSPHESSHSITVLPQQHPIGRRLRSGSVMSHSPSNSMTIVPIPPFPSTVSSITPFTQCAGVLPKYYTPSSLRIFALSRNWKERYIILSAPATLVTKGQVPAVSYLHLFKTSNRDDKELERLEINEESVVFVSEGEVGGRRHVIKVGGTDVGAMKKEYIHEEGGHTMWFLQFSDPVEAQKWITDIKNAILGQRTVRAGIIPAHTLGNNEPRGDMDVMLSIRAQGLVTLPTPRQSGVPALAPILIPQGDSKGNYAPSISSRSVRSQSTAPKSPPPPGPVSTLKEFFTNAVRPRSGSRAASVDSERLDRDNKDDSFVTAGTNLMSILSPNTSQGDNQSINTMPSTPVVKNLPFSGTSNPPVGWRTDQNVAEQRPIKWATTEPFKDIKDRANKTMSTGALSLQPPPRKRWTSTGSSNPVKHVTSTPSGAGAPRRASLSLSIGTGHKAEKEPPSSQTIDTVEFGSTPQRPRTPSLHTSPDEGNRPEGTISNATKRNSDGRGVRRWSRQGILPTRPTPPSDPPPAIPTLQPPSIIRSGSSDQAPSPISSQSSQKSVVSALPTFANKRASVSSARSINSFSTSHSNSGSLSSSHHATPSMIRTTSSHRSSMPPPRPAPTSALPPAPTDVKQDSPKTQDTSVNGSKASYRNSVGHRTFRLSAMISAPKPPPSTTLPPRPDDPEYEARRRSTSNGSANGNYLQGNNKLQTIPASPTPPPKAINPFPPPAGPLPPPPMFSSEPGSTSNGLPTSSLPAPPPKRSTSLKERLRLISAPSSTSGQQHIPSQARLPLTSTTTATSLSSSQKVTTSPPTTPLPLPGDTTFRNDSSFLQMYTPVMQTLPPPQSISMPLPPDDVLTELPSLLPPPRRGSKQLIESELLMGLRDLPMQLEDPSPTEEEPTHLPLSRPSSSINSRLSPEIMNNTWDSPREESSTSPEEDMIPSPTETHHHLSLSRPGSIRSLGKGSSD